MVRAVTFPSPLPSGSVFQACEIEEPVVFPFCLQEFNKFGRDLEWF